MSSRHATMSNGWSPCRRLGCAILLSWLATEAAAAGLTVWPRDVALSDAFARRQILVELDGRDATRQASYSSKNAAIATVDHSGYVTPVAEGATEIVVGVDGRQAVVP